MKRATGIGLWGGAGAVAGIAASVAVLALVPALYAPTGSSPRASCASEIAETYLLLDLCAQASSNGTPGYLALLKDSDPATALGRLLEQEWESKRFFGKRFWVLPSSPLDGIDPWGNPLNVAWVGSPQLGVPGGIIPSRHGLAIWSSGPNGTNQYGRGDDVAYAGWRRTSGMHLSGPVAGRQPIGAPRRNPLRHAPQRTVRDGI